MLSQGADTTEYQQCGFVHLNFKLATESDEVASNVDSVLSKGFSLTILLAHCR